MAAQNFVVEGGLVVGSTQVFDSNGNLIGPTANSSYFSNTANLAFAQANAAFIVANAAITASQDSTYDQAIFNQANGAFDKANTSWSYLQNGSYTATLDSTGQFMLPQITQAGLTAGYLTSVGNIGLNAQGNLWKFGADGTMNSPYSVQITTHGFQWPDGSYQNTAASPIAYTQGAFNQANGAYNFANTVNTYAYAAFSTANAALTMAQDSSYDQSIYNQANAAFVQANLAFNQANTAITTSGGSITGQLNVAFQPATTVNTAVTITAANTKGGTGYADVIMLKNNSGGATNINKYIRLTSIGELQIINSTYQIASASLTDAGDLTLAGNVIMNGVQGGYNASRPAFRISGNGGSISATTTVAGGYMVVDYNQGSYLNTTTGVFTAPVAGLYQVNLIVRTASNSNPGINQVIIRKTAAIGGAVTTQIMVEFGPNTSMNHAGGTTLVKLAAGDTLKFDVTAGTISFDGNDSWSVAYLG